MDNISVERVLQSAYKKWQDEKMDVVRKLSFSDFSQPFFIGVPSSYANSKKTVLVYGQEANNFFRYEDDWSIQGIQEWCREYTDIQLSDEHHPQKNSSPFWRFINSIASRDVNVIWGNLDKAHLYVDGKTRSLDVTQELYLNGQLDGVDKTIVDFEIEAINPDVVVFAIGPSYHKSLSQALSIENDVLSKCKPSKCNSLVDISEITNNGVKVFWTYHPKYQSYIKALDDNVSSILSGLK